MFKTQAAFFLSVGLLVFRFIQAGNVIPGPQNFYNSPPKEHRESVGEQHQTKPKKEKGEVKPLKASGDKQEEICADEDSADSNESLFTIIRAFCRARSK